MIRAIRKPWRCYVRGWTDPATALEASRPILTSSMPVSVSPASGGWQVCVAQPHRLVAPLLFKTQTFAGRGSCVPKSIRRRVCSEGVDGIDFTVSEANPRRVRTYGKT